MRRTTSHRVAPEEMPAVAQLLERLVQPALDPWALDLPPQDPQP